MTLKEIYLKGKNMLKMSKIASPSFECTCLFEFCFGITKQQLIIYPDQTFDIKDVNKFFDLINRRINGEPLQYILGKWEFMGLPFYVGEGILIPRDDTEILVRETVYRISNIKVPKILDLCSGSGAVSIGINYLKNDCVIKAVELSQKAIFYLNKNISINNMNTQISIKKLDILKDYSYFNNNEFDVIVSNPPYIPTNDLKKLQIEVQMEPQMALDGGKDGLVFYRKILTYWSSKLINNGLLAVEIGINQAKDVYNLFIENKFKNIEVIKDINGIDRVILGFKI